MEKEYKHSIGKTSKFIVRFDDLCPNMNMAVWNRIETILYNNKIKPIIAVVPHNEDPNLNCCPTDINFWQKIIKYQEDGFMIALHGYDHVYTSHSSGILGISTNSEFVGLSIESQQKKINDGITIFEKYNITPDCFIAPSHSFDKNTLSVIKEVGINIISDGHTNLPYKQYGLIWLPCQIWDKFKPMKKVGVYTICIHPNNWTKKDLLQFEKDVNEFKHIIVSPFSFTEVEDISLFDNFYNKWVTYLLKIKHLIKRIIRS